MDFPAAREAVRQGADPVVAARAVLAQMTQEERLWCLDGDLPTHAGLAFLQGEDGYHLDTFPAAQVERLGIPGFAFADGPRGCVVGNATAFPVAMARGATWDPDLEERVGEAIGRELRAVGATLTGAVCVNLLRHPAWGRAQETYGEDPFHVGEMAAAATRGLQQHVMACLKHFACNSMENARFSVDVQVDEVALHEVYLPHFLRVVQEGVASVMTAYNSVNGEWCGENHQLLTEVLREEWGFQGFVISDWIFGLRDAATSLAAGLDVEMPYRMLRMRDLEKALADGQASWDKVDTAVEHVLTTLLRFDEVLSRPAPPRSLLGAPEHRMLAREVAARSAVLLRNEILGDHPVLPLREQETIALLGSLGDTVNLGDSGSSEVWDDLCATPLAGLQRAGRDVRHADGQDLTEALRLAAEADVAVVVVGFTRLDEGEYIGQVDPALYALFPPGDEPEVVARFAERKAGLPQTRRPDRLADRAPGLGGGGDRATLRLKDSDVALIRAVAAANQRCVVVLQAGSAVLVDEWVSAVPAVLQSWYAGCEAGTGLADVLVGAVDPSGRLPFSVPVKEEHLPIFDRHATSIRYDRWHGWWHLERQGHVPAYPFGFGLSYTSFVLDSAEVSRGHAEAVVRGTVRNTGDRDGSEVVQVYAQLPDPEAPRRLVGFARVVVPAGQSTTVTIPVALDRLRTRDPDGRCWRPAAGNHVLVVARHVGAPDSHVVSLDV